MNRRTNLAGRAERFELSLLLVHLLWQLWMLCLTVLSLRLMDLGLRELSYLGIRPLLAEATERGLLPV